MKRAIFLITLIFFGFHSFSQNSIAKLKYEQAEEAFSNNDFLTTLTKLEEVEKILGSVNPKILYLRIVAQSKLIDKDKSLIAELRKNCNSYLKQNEENSNLEEKYRDVFLISEMLMQYEDNDNFVTGKKYFEENNFEKAFVYLQKAAAQGYQRSFNYVGEMYDKGLGVQRDDQEALKWYTKAHQAGDGKAACNLGYMYLNGKGAKKDYALAEKYFLTAKEKGESLAFEGLAATYHAREDIENAKIWYEKIADLGSDKAMATLGDLYLVEVTIQLKRPANDQAMPWYLDGIDEAMTWYLKAAEKGNSYAMGRIGYIYLYKGDKKLAKEWLTKGVQKEDAGSMFYMGIGHDNQMELLRSGEFERYVAFTAFKRDPVTAKQWFEKSAALGYVKAMLRLAEIYDSSGTENKQLSEAWRAKAAAVQNNSTND